MQSIGVVNAIWPHIVLAKPRRRHPPVSFPERPVIVVLCGSGRRLTFGYLLHSRLRVRQGRLANYRVPYWEWTALPLSGVLCAQLTVGVRAWRDAPYNNTTALTATAPENGLHRQKSILQRLTDYTSSIVSSPSSSIIFSHNALTVCVLFVLDDCIAATRRHSLYFINNN